MFDVGLWELVVIAVVALLVLGPERLPRAARMAGLWVRKARAQWYSVQAELEREMAAEEYKRSVGKPLEEIERSLAAQARDLRRELESVSADAQPRLADASHAGESDTGHPRASDASHPRESGDPRPAEDEPTSGDRSP